MNIISIPESWRERAVVVRGSEIPESWFSAEELATAEAFVRHRRRQEWLLSRLAAKRLAIDRGLASEPAACRIEDRRIRSWFLSLSHSHGYAAAALDRTPIGIDIERVRSIDERAAHFFLTESESEMLRAVSLPERLIHFWAAKEAVWKQKEGAVPTLKGVPIRLRGQSDTGLTFDVAETTRTGELIVALTSA